MQPKKIKILFHTITKYRWTKGIHEGDRHSPFYEITEVLKYVKRLPKKTKFRDKPGGKFCFLSGYTTTSNGDGTRIVIKGSFKSARSEFRPNLINKRTGTERENPKLLTEGDINTTHFAILIDRNKGEVYVLLEYNYHGVNMNNVMNYLGSFNRTYLESKSLPKNYTLKYFTIPKTNFLQALRSLKRAKLANVYFDKQLLGSDALNFSNRTVGLKSDLVLTIKTETGQSMKSTAIDLFNRLNGQDSPISKIRIEGQDQNDNDIILDTTSMNKASHLTIDRNPTTGELISLQVFSGLDDIIDSI